EGAVAAVLEQFDACQGGTQAEAERAPVAGFVQGGAEAQDGVTEEVERRHTGEEAAFPQHEVGVQMADGSLFELRELCADALLAPEEGQGGGVVAEEQEALARLEGIERAADVGEVLGAEAFPFGPLGGQGVGPENREGDKRRDKTQENIAADFQPPEGLQAYFLAGAAPTGQAHAAVAAEHGDLAQFVVAEVQAQVGAESLAELAEALSDALAGRIVAQTDEGRVAGVIAIGDDVIEVGAVFEELIEEMVLTQRLAQPDVVAIEAGKSADDGVADFPQFEVMAAGLFGGGGVMNVAQDAERAGAHGASDRGGEKDLEGGAFVGLALDADGAVVFLDDAPGDEQAQAGAVGLGGEERFEEALHILGGDADAVI